MRAAAAPVGLRFGPAAIAVVAAMLSCANPKDGTVDDPGLPVLPSPALRIESAGEPVRHDDLDGDNWPNTWSADGTTLAVYGDGWGARSPKSSPKLNTGMVRLSGPIGELRAAEIAIPHFGNGAEDPNFKGCGLLELNGVIYHFLRYQSPGSDGTRTQVASKLIWSSDGGATWENADWGADVEAMRFFFREPDHAFHSPTFLQAGRGYADAPDEFVYVYSPEGDARRGNDAIVLARVPLGAIRDRSAYRFFAGRDDRGEPVWSPDIADRKPVLRLEGHGSPGDVVYVKELGRYVLATVAGDMDGPSRLTLLDSGTPWGPWTLVGTIVPWGTGRDGDHRYDPRLPQAWIRGGGMEMDLVFSDRRLPDKLNHQTIRLAPRQASGEFEWEPGDPASSGFDETRLYALRDDLMRRGTRALLVARGDRVVLEAYAPGFGPRSLFGTASLAKAIVGGTALLLAVQDGLVSLDDPASRFIPAWSNDPLRSRITLRHLATHSSGLEDTLGPRQTDPSIASWKREFWKRSRPPWAFWRPDPNPFRIARDEVPLLFEPGTRFSYSNTGVAALDLCVATALHRKGEPELAAFLRARVFDPIGLEPGAWSISYGRAWELDGIPLRATWGGARFTARSTARLGRLFLREGVWQGRRILSPEWVRAAPGLLWRSNRDLALPSLPPDAYFGVGAGHQVLLVVPSLELVVVRYGGTALVEPEDRLGFWSVLERHLFAPLAASLRTAPHVGA